MKIKEIRELSIEELHKRIVESKKNLFDLRLKQAAGQLEKASTIRDLRKDVARMKTILRERELNSGGDK